LAKIIFMKEAIILAGGLGTRLQSVVYDRPKCMAIVADKPFLEYILNYLAKQGFNHVILALGYKSENVLEWISEKNFPFEISYVIESEPLGTGGAIKLASGKLKSEVYFVMNGDTYFDVDTNSLLNFYRNNNADIVLALKPMSKFDRYGSVDINDNYQIISFNEKKYKDYGLINGGIYVLNKKLFNGSEKSKFSFEKDILENNIEKLNIIGFIQDTYFIDIGIPSDYEKANIDFLK